jgi:hypothetical protein
MIQKLEEHFSTIGKNFTYSVISIKRSENDDNFKELIDQMSDSPGYLSKAIYEMEKQENNVQKYQKVDRILKLIKLYGECSRYSDYIVVADDDCKISMGSVSSSIGVMHNFNLDLAQISHSIDSNCNYEFVRQIDGLIGRSTRFVEIGPLLIVRANQFLDFFPIWHIGMGWGLEAYWNKLVYSGKKKIGIIDLNTIVHLKPASNYSTKFDSFITNSNINFYLDIHKYPKSFEIERWVV